MLLSSKVEYLQGDFDHNNVTEVAVGSKFKIQICFFFFILNSF